MGALKFFIGVALVAPGIYLFIRTFIDAMNADDRSTTMPNSRRWVSAVGVLVVGIVIISTLLPSVGQVAAGQAGVVLRFGGVTGRVLDEGLYFVTPIADQVKILDVQIQAGESTATASSADLQDVSTTVVVNYRLDRPAVATTYQTLGYAYSSRIITPSVQEAVKAATALFNAERLVVDRPKVREQIKVILAERLRPHGIILEALSITDFTFSEEFTRSIEAKVTATQNALKAENDLKRVEFEAQQRVATAQAEAEAIRIQAESISATGGEAYVSLKAVEKWDGALPRIMTPDGALPFLNLQSN